MYKITLSRKPSHLCDVSGQSVTNRSVYVNRKSKAVNTAIKWCEKNYVVDSKPNHFEYRASVYRDGTLWLTICANGVITGALLL